MDIFLLATWFFSLLILTGYSFLIHRVRPSTPKRLIIEWPGVSIVIAHRNHAQSLIRNMSVFLQQDYPLFEIIIVDDHSSPDQIQKLKNDLEGNEKIRLVTNNGNGKKQALSTGIQLAQYEIIQLTDADCRPGSFQWLRKMVVSGAKKGIVLGYAPYESSRGLLNLFVRFETLMTGMQYLSWASMGRPYMSVGRNTMYAKAILSPQSSSSVHSKIPYGDDDLTLQSLVEKAPVYVMYHEDAHVYSKAADSWTEWWQQKHRHLSAGRYYKRKHWMKPGIFGIALITHWLLLSALFFLFPLWRFIPVLIIGLIIRWFTYAMWSRKLGEGDTVLWYPILEIGYTIYLGMMGIKTILKPSQGWS